MNQPAEHLAHKGDSWNESIVAPDPVTGRPVRRLTAAVVVELPAGEHPAAGDKITIENCEMGARRLIGA